MFHLISVIHKCFRHFIYVIWFLLTVLCYLLSTIPILLAWTGRNVITNEYIYYSVQNYYLANHNSHDNCVYYNYQYSEFPKRNNPICKKNDFYSDTPKCVKHHLLGHFSFSSYFKFSFFIKQVILFQNRNCYHMLF